jgi:hypothetical protein
LNNKKSVLSSVAIPTNPSLSSSQSTDESSSSAVHQSEIPTTKTRLFHRMISLRRSSTNQPSIYRSYNLRAFEIAHDHYSIIIHFLDETERTFYVDVSSIDSKNFC